MRIGIDARVLDRGMTGTGRYLLNLVNEIPALDKQNEYFIYASNKSLYDADYFQFIDVKESIIPPKIHSPVWLNTSLPGLNKKFKIDVYFTANILVPFIHSTKTKSVTVVHDVIHKVNKEFYPFSYRKYLGVLLPITLKKAHRIITVSQHSKNDIIKYYNIPEDKIDVVYASAEDKFAPRNLKPAEINILKQNYSLPDTFILFVGVIERRKNIKCLLKIADSLKAKNINLPLVILGRPGYGFNEISSEIEARKEYVHYLNFVDDKSLPYIYNMAHALVFPSYYEGFGLPPLEAMQSGLPVVSSSGSSLSEVIDEGGLLFDPDDVEGFSGGVEKLFRNKDFYEEYKSKGLNRAKYFNSKKSCMNLLSLFNKL